MRPLLLFGSVAPHKWLSLSLALLLATSSVQGAGLSCDRVWASTPLSRTLDRAAAIHAKIRPYLQSEVRVPHLRHERDLSERSLRLLQMIYNRPIQILSPLSTQRVLPWEAPANKVMMKLWRNRNYKPTRSEWAILKKYKAADAFRSRRTFLQKHPNWHRFRKTAIALSRSYLAAIFLLHSFFAEEAADNTQTVSDYLKAEDGDEFRVEILNETTPFPHIAIRVGKRVYSYGFERMTALSLSEYLTLPETDSEKSALRKWSEKHLPRSIQSVQLKLSPAEANALRLELESHRGKVYKNMTMVNDCASMIARALSKTTSVHIPWEIDASPATMFTYLIMLKIKNDPRIGIFRQITEDGVEASLGLGARNVWISSMESKLWRTTMTFNIPLRALMNLTLEDEEIQTLDENEIRLLEEMLVEIGSSARESEQEAG